MGKGKGLLILLCWVGELLGVGCILGILIFLGVCGFCFCVCAAFGKDEENPEESVASQSDANHRDTAIVPIGIQSVPFTFGNAQQHQNGKSLGESRNEQMVEIRRLLALHQLCKEGGNERQLFGQQQQQSKWFSSGQKIFLLMLNLAKRFRCNHHADKQYKYKFHQI